MNIFLLVIKKLMVNKTFLFFKKLLKFIKVIKYSPFSLQSRFKPRRLYSDFFVLNTKFHRTFFIAENVYYLYEKRKLKVNHEFKFFDEEGRIIKIFRYSSNKLFSKILLPKIESKSKYISFTHNSYDKIQDKYLNKNLSIQHRGYTIFHKKKKSLGAILHGNTGSIAPDKSLKSSMVQRDVFFVYTPIYQFSKEEKYDLVFNNPTNQKLEIKIFLDYHNSEKSKIRGDMTIEPYGTKFISISKHDGSISFISKLGICRCAVFKNPRIDKENFDVFHS